MPTAIRWTRGVVGLLAILVCCALQADEPKIVVRTAEPYRLPGAPLPDGNTDMDCNCPVHWDGDTMYAFFSLGHPYRSDGPDWSHLSKPSTRGEYHDASPWKGGGRWIEATYKAEDGTLYGWYHNEPHPICDSEHLTAPLIGQVVSKDNGLTWKDQGYVLMAPPDSFNCQTKNFYFVGGIGDFCVNLDHERKFFYFFISTYDKDIKEQGVAVARMPFDDLASPVGKVVKWHKGQWSEPGLGGHVTPIWQAKIDWHNEKADAFWGPSVHWNTHIQQWVMLLNRAKDKDWNQEGVYVSRNTDLSQPQQWTEPKKILEGDMKTVHWYPQVIGIDAAARETDKLAGRVARLFVKGLSNWEIVFLNPGEKE